jgi:Zn-dependent protease
MLAIALSRMEDILLMAPPLLLSLTIHEYAHARVALAFGDPTAHRMGRCTLNPLKHLTVLGTMMLLFSGIIGWAKPVPVTPYNLRPRRLGSAMVSLAGPMSNLALACICALAIWGVQTVGVKHLDSEFILSAIHLLIYTIVANLGLCVFNLLPLFPLDGHHIIREILPERLHRGFMAWQVKYGVVLLATLIFGPRVLENVLNRPVFDPLRELFGHVIGYALTIVL